MARTIKTGLALAALAAAFSLQPSVYAQEPMKQDSMKHDKMQDDKMQDDKMMREGKAKTLVTGKFHGNVHKTEGGPTTNQEGEGNLLLRRINLKPPTGPMCT